MIAAAETALRADALQWAGVGVALLGFFGLLYGAGALLFLAAFPQVSGALITATRRRGAVWSLAALLAALAAAPAQAAFLGGGWPMALDPTLLTLVLDTSAGEAMTIKALGALGLFAGLIASAKLRVAGLCAGAAAMVALCYGHAHAGHVSALAPPLIWRVLLVAHLCAAAFWLGALAPLQRAAADLPAQQAATVMRRFGLTAMAALAVLFAAGGAMFVGLVGPTIALETSAYRQFLAVKLALVVALLGFAAWHKLRLAQALGRQAGAGAALARSIGRERVAAALVVIAAALMTGLSGPTSP